MFEAALLCGYFVPFYGCLDPLKIEAEHWGKRRGARERDRIVKKKQIANRTRKTERLRWHGNSENNHNEKLEKATFLFCALHFHIQMGKMQMICTLTTGFPLIPAHNPISMYSIWNEKKIICHLSACLSHSTILGTNANFHNLHKNQPSITLKFVTAGTSFLLCHIAFSAFQMSPTFFLNFNFSLVASTFLCVLNVHTQMRYIRGDSYLKSLQI